MDKPDLRYGLEIQDLTPLIGGDAAPFVHEAVKAGGRVRGIVARRARPRRRARNSTN